MIDETGAELATVFQVDVPFLLQQAQFLYEKQLEELQLQMQRVNSSASVLDASKGIRMTDLHLILTFIDSAESQHGSGTQFDVQVHQRQVNASTPPRPILPQNRNSRICREDACLVDK